MSSTPKKRGRKWKKVVSSDFLEGLSVRKRVLRSDVAKKRALEEAESAARGTGECLEESDVVLVVREDGGWETIVADELSRGDGLPENDGEQLTCEEDNVGGKEDGIDDKVVKVEELEEEVKEQPSKKLKSKVRKKVKVTIENRRFTRSSFAELKESGLERRNLVLTVKEKKRKTDSTSSCRQDQTVEIEGKKLKTPSLNCLAPECKHIVPNSKQRRVHKKVAGSGKVQMGKTLPVKEEINNEDGTGPKPLFPSGASIWADIANSSHLTKQEKETKFMELRNAKKNVRDRIKDMILSAGWKIDLRQRSGKKCLDAVYVSPEGCTHWSIVKAYRAFEKQVLSEYDDETKHLSRSLCKKSQKASLPPFSSIPEEDLSLLKHPISRRRTYKELEEANVKHENGIISKKHLQLKGGKCKGRVKATEDKKPHQGKVRKTKKRCGLLVRSSNRSGDVYVPYTWKRTILSWVIDLGIVSENATVTCMNPRPAKALLKGQMTRGGINCSCCCKIFTLADFETHAGSKQCKPYQNIFVEDSGASLLDCLIKAWQKQDESKRMGFHSVDINGDDVNDDTCGICGDGGDLICCDSCPSTFHPSCLGTEMLPEGDWYCMNCSCRYCRIASGIVTEENGDLDSPLLSCSQCEEKYHQACVPEEDAIPARSRKSCIPFCGLHCQKVSDKLQKLLGVKNLFDAGFSWTIVQRVDDDLPESVSTLEQRAKCNSKIAVALAVMDECFFPIIDQRSGIDLIHSVVYNCGSNFNRLNYRGFYSFILERDDEVISVASVRIHGTRVAEMPFIGTRTMYRHQGMCRRLLNKIELALRSLNIEKLVIPAISELMDTWINVFGFQLLEASQKEEIKSMNLLVFPDTGLLVKPLLEKGSGGHCKTSGKGVTEISAQEDLPLQPEAISLDEP